jgi:hypothetical protein
MAWLPMKVIDSIMIGTVPTGAALSYLDVPVQPAPAGRCP